MSAIPEDLLAKLVAIPSFSGKEGKVVAFIKKWIETHTSFVIVPVGKNLVVRVPGCSSEAALLFNGHVDTVGCEPKSDWTHDPFRLTEENDKLYGLGASDMKGAIAVFLSLIEQYTDKQPPCDVYFLFVTEEETTGAGTQEVLMYLQKEAILKKYRHLAGVVAEATNLKVAIGHRGNMFAKVALHGEGGHASRPPSRGVQVIYKASQFIDAISSQSEMWKQKYADELFGPPTIAITSINTPINAINQIPTRCTVSIDIRTNPTFHKHVDAEIDKLVAPYGQLVSSTKAPVGFASPEESIATIAMQLAHQENPDVRQGSTDQCFMTEAGIPTIICGPGEVTRIHAPDEYITVSVLEESIGHYQRLIEAWASSVISIH